jgi:hypothetical protein
VSLTMSGVTQKHAVELASARAVNAKRAEQGIWHSMRPNV